MLDPQGKDIPVPDATRAAVERDSLLLEYRGKWVNVEYGLQMIRLQHRTYASLEYGTLHSNGVREKSHCTRFYYDDGTFYTSIRG